MRKRLVSIIMTLLVTGVTLSGQGRMRDARRLIAEGDSLHRAYLFDDAVDKYMLAVDAGIDDSQRAELEKKIGRSQNGTYFTGTCADPKVIGREPFSRADFFLYYPLKSQSWHASPNLLDSLSGFPTYFPKGAKDVVFSAADRTGARNLFYSHSTDTSWTAPRLLGESLTTLGNEIFPMLSPDGKTLYFASDGLPGLGGYDLFSSAWDEETGSWGQPVNMGIPYSSPADDFLLMDTDDGKYTIFASNRDCSRDSVRVYVLDFEGSREMVSVMDYKDLRRITSLTPVQELGRMDHDAFSESVEENDVSLLYNQVSDEIRALRDSILVHSADADPTRREEISSRIQELNVRKEQLYEDFLHQGIVRQEEDKELAGVGSGYTFGKNNIGPRIRLRIDKPRRNGSFRVMPVGRLAQDSRLPDGLVYQIQFAQSTRHLDVEAMGGLSPVYETLSRTNLRYIYTVGIFDNYYEALAELNTVRAQGFPEASIIAWKDGRQISVSQARQEENNTNR